MTKDRKDWLKDWSKVIFLISIVFACGKLYQKLDTLESNQVSARQENKEEHQSIKADLKECKDKRFIYAMPTYFF